jgi:hypothetical protein
MRRHRHNLTPAQQEKLAAYLLAHSALEAIYRFKQRPKFLPKDLSGVIVQNRWPAPSDETSECA